MLSIFYIKAIQRAVRDMCYRNAESEEEGTKIKLMLSNYWQTIQKLHKNWYDKKCRDEMVSDAAILKRDPSCGFE